MLLQSSGNHALAPPQVAVDHSLVSTSPFLRSRFENLNMYPRSRHEIFVITSKVLLNVIFRFVPSW